MPTPNTAAPAARLPRELVDLITDELDTKSLAACTLMCRFWNTCARPRLFRTVIVHDHGGPHYDSESPCCGRSTYTFDALRRFLWYTKPLEDPPQFVTFIKRLVVVGLEAADVDDVTISMVDLDLILAKLPGLIELRLQNISLQPCLPGIRLFGWSHRRPLTSLDIDGSMMEPPSWALVGSQAHETSLEEPECALADLLALFTSIGTLRIINFHFRSLHDPAPYGIYWDDRSRVRPVLARIPRDLRVQRLAAEVTDILTQASVLLLLLESGCFHGLQYLRIHDEPPVVRTILQAIGCSSISVLRLGLGIAPIGIDPLFEPDEYGLSFCSNLTSYSLDVWGIDRRLPNDYRPLLDVVRRSCQSISHLTINFYLTTAASDSNINYLQDIPWETLENTLVSRSLLSRLSIMLCPYSWLFDGTHKADVEYTKEAVFIKQQLSRLNAKKSVQIEFDVASRSR
ncbi:hypothetical protein EIP91_007516 [Steccherinum ochraceum]|uniref:F-box domain-containing protein n=1 Tax=Steccherinum ochraceum TaxID=92696 RepID=A0A4V2MVD5_9APHY|nr:hypothetical protein EIP91_007516 [Steccherinum ochraceum]